MGRSGPSPDTPLVTVGRDGGRNLVMAADAAAQRQGIVPGMAATKARALSAELQVQQADPAADAEALDKLALWALKLYAPVVAADPPDGLCIDATGAAHRYGGEQGLLDDLLGRLKASGVAARAAMTRTYGAAHALARYAANPTLRIGEGELGPAIRNLPVAALRLPLDTVDALRRLGFDSIGELDAQPRAPLALRFGPEIGRRLDQAYGRACEPMILASAPELIEVRRGFAEPISAPETLARYTAILAEQLCATLEAKALGARCLDLLFHRVDGRVEAIRVGTSKPSRDVKSLIRLLSPKLEAVDPGFGIELMILSAPVAEPLIYRQSTSGLTEESEADISGLVDTLSNRLGPHRLYRAVPIESDVPERSVGRVAPLAPKQVGGWSAQWPRPARLLPRPEPIQTVALLPDHPPASFTWRGVRRKVCRADGPERIFGEWWKRDAEASAVRDYFQVEDETGERFWVFRSGDGEHLGSGDQRWFLHGVFG
jgi:protein ImuB